MIPSHNHFEDRLFLPDPPVTHTYMKNKNSPIEQMGYANLPKAEKAKMDYAEYK